VTPRAAGRPTPRPVRVPIITLGTRRPRGQRLTARWGTLRSHSAGSAFESLTAPPSAPTPNAANTDGTRFTARPGTPTVTGLAPASLAADTNTAGPERLPASMPLTCEDHGYSNEQKAFDGGLVDAFVEHTDVESCAPPDKSVPDLVMDHYDGNAVTMLWNYARHDAMSDNSFGTVFGPSTPGALNLVSGQTHGGYAVTPAGVKTTDPYVVAAPDANGVGTVINDRDPAFDDCANAHNHLLPQAA
jgi:phospholipase C